MSALQAYTGAPPTPDPASHKHQMGKGVCVSKVPECPTWMLEPPPNIAATLLTFSLVSEAAEQKARLLVVLPARLTLRYAYDRFGCSTPCACRRYSLFGFSYMTKVIGIQKCYSSILPYLSLTDILGLRFEIFLVYLQSSFSNQSPTAGIPRASLK